MTLCAYVFSQSVMSHFATIWTVAHQALPSMEFTGQEYWSVLPFPPSGDLPHPGIEPSSLCLLCGWVYFLPLYYLEIMTLEDRVM